MKCKLCKKEFVKEHNRQEYCSTRCRSIARSKQKQQYKKRNNNKTAAICKYCAKPFQKSHNRQEYCSLRCSKYARLEQKEEYFRKYSRRYPVAEKLGSGGISGHMNKQGFQVELRIINNEKRRLKIY